jgi:hypothetical protein
VEDADCGKSVLGETPQELYATRRLTNRPRKAKSSTEINSGIIKPGKIKRDLLKR